MMCTRATSKSSYRARRCVLAMFDVLGALAIALFISPALSAPAFAYVDPSVMTYTIQAVAGVAVALSAVAGVAFRRSRRAIMKLLNIDENRNKEVDPAWREVPGDPQNATRDASWFVQGAQASQASNDGGDKRAAKPAGPNWLTRFGIAFLAVLLCGFTVGITAPLELVAGNASNLTFGLNSVWPIMVVATLVATLVLSLLITALRDGAFRFIVLFLCCCGVCMHVQSLFMNGGLVLSDNQSIDWMGTYLPITVVSTIVWLVVLIVPQIFARKNQRIAGTAITVVSLFLILVQVVGVGSLFVGGNNEGGSVEPSIVTQKGMLEVSDKSNVVYIVLDHFDERELDRLVAADEHVLDFLPGSTVYTNAMETMTPTEFALPYMMTGVVPQVGEDINGSFLTRRYAEGTFLQALEDTGYEVGIYTDTLRLSNMGNAQAYDYVARHTDNIHPTTRESLNKRGALKILVKASLYRNLPWLLKPRFLYSTGDLNAYMVNTTEGGLGADDQPYVCDDIAFYHKVLDTGLSLDPDDNAGNYRFIHLDGNHWPWEKNENAEPVAHTDEGRDADAIGSLKIVDAYIQQLKDLGVYDKTTIIITADHGDWEAHGLPEDVSVPILIVKPAAEGSEQRVPVFNNAPVGHEDLFATILEAMGADGSQYGDTLTQVEERYGTDPAQRTRETYMAAANDGFTTITDLYLFQVQGDARNWDNWTYMDTTWHVQDSN